MCIIKHKETIFYSCQVDPIVSYFMKFVDQKHAAFTGMLKQPLLLASLFWSLIFVIVFATDIRYTFGDKVALTLSLAACCSLAILTWRHTRKENRRHALALFMFAATAPTLVLLGTMFLDVRFTSSRIVFNAWFLLFCFIALRYLSKTHSSSFLHPAANDPSHAPRRQKRFRITPPRLIVLSALVFFFASGAIHIGRQAVVDEALWTYDRIPRFFENLRQGEFANTRVSDKPGLTISLISGVALTRYTPDPLSERQYDPQAEEMYGAFRLPILIMATLLLALIFRFASRATDEYTGALTTLLIATSPVLIGASRIINPDALLWGFFSLAFFAYFAFLKTKHRLDIIWSGIFFGLALATKYVSNFFIIYLLAFLPFIFTAAENPAHLRHSLLDRLREIASIFIIGLSTLLILYPAIWLRPDRLLTATFLSQAYTAVALPIGLLVLFLIADMLFRKSAFLLFLSRLVARYRSALFRSIAIVFACCVIILLASVWLNIPPIDFPRLLASPKSSFEFEGVSSFAFYIANFYPLIFGISPLLLLGAIAGMIVLIRTGDRTRHGLPLLGGLLFILCYYAGATASAVLSVTRYQIVIFPIFAFISAIGIRCLLSSFLSDTKWKTAAVPLIVLILIGSGAAYSAIHAAPYFSSYSSLLLPRSLVTEYKDMGDGLYEAAAYLNALPNATSLTVYTDRTPLCRFFVGTCLTGFANTKLMFKHTTEHYDYIVVHSSNQARVHRFADPLLAAPHPNTDALRLVRYDRAYDFPDPDHSISIHDRPGQIIKIIRGDRISLKNDGP